MTINGVTVTSIKIYNTLDKLVMSDCYVILHGVIVLCECDGTLKGLKIHLQKLQTGDGQLLAYRPKPDRENDLFAFGK